MVLGSFFIAIEVPLGDASLHLNWASCSTLIRFVLSSGRTCRPCFVPPGILMVTLMRTIRSFCCFARISKLWCRVWSCIMWMKRCWCCRCTWRGTIFFIMATHLICWVFIKHRTRRVWWTTFWSFRRDFWVGTASLTRTYSVRGLTPFADRWDWRVLWGSSYCTSPRDCGGWKMTGTGSFLCFYSPFIWCWSSCSC